MAYLFSEDAITAFSRATKGFESLDGQCALYQAIDEPVSSKKSVLVQGFDPQPPVAVSWIRDKKAWKLVLTSLIPVPGDSSFLEVVNKGVYGRFAVIIVNYNTAY